MAEKFYFTNEGWHAGLLPAHFTLGQGRKVPVMLSPRWALTQARSISSIAVCECDMFTLPCICMQHQKAFNSNCRCMCTWGRIQPTPLTYTSGGKVCIRTGAEFHQLPPDLPGHWDCSEELHLPQVLLMSIHRAVLTPDVTVSHFMSFEYMVWRPAPFPQTCSNTPSIVFSAKIQFPWIFWVII